MERVLGTALAFGLAWLIGYFLVTSLWREQPRDLADRLLRFAAAFGLGVGIASILDFLWIAVIGKASRWIALMDLVVLLIVFVARRLSREDAAPADRAPPAFGWASGATFLFFTAIALGIAAVILLRTPSGGWDAIAIWNAHAKFLNAPSTNGWKAIFDPIVEITHPDYPPLLPAFIARGWIYAGESIHLVPMVLAFSFTLALLALITGAVASARGGALGALACAVLAASPIFLGTALAQYADLPLAFFFLLAVALLHRADQDDSPRAGLHVLAGLAAGMAALTKNEGQLFILALGAGRLLHLLLAARSRRELKNLGWLLFGMAPILCVVRLYKSFAPANYLLSGQGKDFWKRLLSVLRALLIIDQLRIDMEKPDSFAVWFLQRIRTWHWHLLAASLFILLFGLDRRRFAHRLSRWGLALVVLGVLADIVGTRLATGAFGWHWTVALIASALIVGLGFDRGRFRHPSFLAAATTLVVVNAGYFVVYLVTPLDLKWQLARSIQRLEFHTMPMAIFVAFLVVASWGRRPRLH